MFDDIGFPELMVILLIALVIFGGGKAKEIWNSLIFAVKEFKGAMKEAANNNNTVQLFEENENCPFCGHDKFEIETQRQMGVIIYKAVVCSKCGSKGPDGVDGIKDTPTALENWNKRTGEQI